MRKKLFLIFPIVLILILSISMLFACSTENTERTTTKTVMSGPIDSTEDSTFNITSISVLDSLEPITFGKYPQTINSSIAVSQDKKSNGYYLGVDKNYYALKKGSYYKVEDIVWDAFRLESGDILLVSQKILYSVRYDDFHDYFDDQMPIIDEKGFIFSEEESAKIKDTKVSYEYSLALRANVTTKMFFLTMDEIQSIYPSASKVLKAGTDYAKINLEVSDYGYSTWWIAPSKGKNYYVSLTGTFSNKSNTTIQTIDGDSKIQYTYRGFVPAMIISNN